MRLCQVVPVSAWCPHCGIALDARSARSMPDTGNKIIPGTLAFCTACGKVSRFDTILELRPLSRDDQRLLNAALFDSQVRWARSQVLEETGRVLEGDPL